LWNAACAVDGTTIRGRSMSGRATRAACTASMQLSVPPEVTLPTVDGPPPSSPAAAATMSFSIRSRLGNAVGSRPFAEVASACACAASESKPDSPLS
jgi:hypothetical protein